MSNVKFLSGQKNGYKSVAENAWVTILENENNENRIMIFNLFAEDGYAVSLPLGDVDLTVGNIEKDKQGFAKYDWCFRGNGQIVTKPKKHNLFLHYVKDEESSMVCSYRFVEAVCAKAEKVTEILEKDRTKYLICAPGSTIILHSYNEDMVEIILNAEEFVVAEDRFIMCSDTIKVEPEEKTDRVKISGTGKVLIRIGKPNNIIRGY